MFRLTDEIMIKDVKDIQEVCLMEIKLNRKVLGDGYRHARGWVVRIITTTWQYLMIRRTRERAVKLMNELEKKINETLNNRDK